MTIDGLSRQRAGETADALNAAMRLGRGGLTDREWELLADLNHALRDVERGAGWKTNSSSGSPTSPAAKS